MSVVLDGPTSLAVTKVEDVSEATSAIVFFGLCMVLGIGTRHLLCGTKVPYTVALLVGLGSLEFGTNLRLGKLGVGIRLWVSINPDLLLAKCIWQMLILAGSGVLISTFCLNWSWKTSLLLAGLLSATDPVAVVALLKELGASKELTTIIDGESMMNDGVAVVVYQFFYHMVLGESFMVSVFWFGFIVNDTVIEISLILAVSYLAYFTVQDSAGVSGILAMMALRVTTNRVSSILGNGFLRRRHSHFHLNCTWGYLVLLYVLVQVSRAIVVGTLYPFLHYFVSGLDWKEAIVLFWSSLRGVVALSMALSVKRVSDNSSFLNHEKGALFLFFTSGIVFLTIIVNGSTTSFVLHFLGMNNCLNNLEEDHVHPQNGSKIESNIDAMNLRDTRVRLLIGVQAAYWGMLHDGRIAQNTATTLLGSVDEAIVLVSRDSLCDWKVIKSHVHFPSHYRLLQMSICPQELATYLTVDRLEFACYVCAAFLHAHRIARRQLHDFMGDSEIVSLVINESESEGDEARIFLEEVCATFPQVLHVVKIRQATYAVLKHLSEYVENLKKVGILEDKEMIHLHDSVQTDLEKVFKNPPSAKMPKIDDMLRVHRLLSALPSIARLHLEDSTRELTKLRGVAICLYEVLSGKPYICDLITDSVVYCFFVGSEMILSLLKADPAVEDILWQESVVVIAKLLLPQVFEKMVLQDLRSLVMERSGMNIYMRGDIIEIPPRSIGFLLEGFVTTITDQEEMITSPGVLLPIYGDLSFLSLETSGSKAASIYHQGTSYQIATRARVIILDMATVEADLQLQRRTSSWIYAAEESPKCLSREHKLQNVLESWPEPLHVDKQGPQGNVGSSYGKPTGYQEEEVHGHLYTRVPSTEQVQPLENS
ncbi:hypothetical protein MKX01_027277 [Papaver californicum]|nr:hypothetical protein MKX01_027277 [Papaver californicum]